MRSIGRHAQRIDGELVAQREELLAVGHHALIDLEHHGQDGGDEELLALVAVLVAEVGRHAVDLDGRHGLALADVGEQREGDVAEEAGELVGGARADGTELDLAAQRVAGRGEAAMAHRRIDDRAMDVVRLVGRRRQEGQRLRLGIHGDQRHLVGRGGLGVADRREGQIGGGIEGGQRLAEADAGCEYGGPHHRKRILSPAIRSRAESNNAFHTLVSFAQTNGPSHAAPTTTPLQPLRCTLERKAAYWAACTSTTSGT